VIAVNLMGQVVFLMKGIKPHRWLEKTSARQSVGLSITVSLLLLAAVVLIMAARG
jgi:hypothetical protein